MKKRGNPNLNRKGALGGRRKGCLRRIRMLTEILPRPEGFTITLAELELRWGIDMRAILSLEKEGLMPWRVEERKRYWLCEEIGEYEQKVLPNILSKDEEGVLLKDNRPYEGAKEQRLEQQQEEEITHGEVIDYDAYIRGKLPDISLT